VVGSVFDYEYQYGPISLHVRVQYQCSFRLSSSLLGGVKRTQMAVL
jgi:hypothetical protein